MPVNTITNFLVYIPKMSNQRVIELKSLLHGVKHIGVSITARRERTMVCTFSSPIHLQGQHKANQTLIYVEGCHKKGLFRLFLPN